MHRIVHQNKNHVMVVGCFVGIVNRCRITPYYQQAVNSVPAESGIEFSVYDILPMVFIGSALVRVGINLIYFKIIFVCFKRLFGKYKIQGFFHLFVKGSAYNVVFFDKAVAQKYDIVCFFAFAV